MCEGARRIGDGWNMKITEQDLSTLRPKCWPWLAHMDEIRTAKPDLFTDSWDAFPWLADNTRQFVALLGFSGPVPPLDPDLEWWSISHQSGGLACHHPHFIGLVLDIKPEMLDALGDLVANYYEAAGGHFYNDAVTASDIVTYVSRLAEVGLHCERSHRLLEEAVYPIDARVEHLHRIANDLPSFEEIARGCVFSEPRIVLLTENSD
jgi:hypothetical protein